MAPKPRPILDRLADKFLIGDDCWEWTGAKSQGYGVFWMMRNHRNERASHVLYELMVGPIPEGMWVLHHCDNPGCVRPDHLFLGTQHQNMADCAAKGRNGGAQYQASKTHCPKGHPYDEDNTYPIPSGGRGCRECKREYDRKAGARPMATRTHCPQGHPYDDENTYRTPEGYRSCRACQRAATAKWLSKRRKT